MDTYDSLTLDPAETVAIITGALRRHVGALRRSGIVVAMSGGVDSAVGAALAAAAVGASRVLGLALPERESEAESVTLAHEWASTLGIDFRVEDITTTLEACGCYDRRDAVIGHLLPYGNGWRCKLVQDAGDDSGDRLPLCYLVVQEPGGVVTRRLLPASEFREIVAATNFKQRVRAMVSYYHADRLGYAVLGTANRLEYDQGFFVKGGDGLADMKPLAHLYKGQVYQLAEYLGVHARIRTRPPTTDTYSMPQTQEEFYFTMPLGELDRVLEAKNAGRPAPLVAGAIGASVERVQRAYNDIDRKREATRYLHVVPLLVEPVPEIDTPAVAAGAEGLA